MREFHELFRIFVGSVRHSRDQAKEQQTISQLKSTVQTSLVPMTMRGRLRFFLENDPQDHTQWLVVSCHGSLQHQLFMESDTRSHLPAHRDYQAEAAVATVAKALTRLRHLSQQAQWNPVDFMEIIRTDQPIGANLLTSREDGVHLRTNDGRDVIAEGVRSPRRTLLPDPINVSFRVDMVGRDKASIATTKSHRRALKIPGRLCYLHWSPLEQPSVYSELRAKLELNELAQAEVFLLVDKHGQTTDFLWAHIS
jgi:chloramphenicol 3-O-phosphotransferase